MSLGQLDVLGDDSTPVPSAPKVRALLAILLLPAGRKLSLSLVKDDCDARRVLMTAGVFVRE